MNVMAETLQAPERVNELVFSRMSSARVKVRGGGFLLDALRDPHVRVRLYKIQGSPHLLVELWVDMLGSGDKEAEVSWLQHTLTHTHTRTHTLAQQACPCH